MSRFGNAGMTVMKKAVALAPDRWMPGGKPDPLIEHEHGLIGTAVSRIDGPLKVRGEARFAAEFALEGMAYAALVFSTIAKGRVAAFDTRAAEAVPGVVLVMTHRNAPEMKALPFFMAAAKAAAGDNLPIMQDDRVHWNGQPIALVLAETQEQADHAKSLIRVTYEAEGASPGLNRPRRPDSIRRSLPGSCSSMRSRMPKRRWRRRPAGWMRRTGRRATTTMPSNPTR